MAYKDFIPASDTELARWATAFGAKLEADAASFGISEQQAEAFAALVSAFNAALATASEPASRTRVSIAAKDAARAPMIAMARDIARQIHALPGITNAQRIELGLNPHCDAYQKVPVPAEAPVLKVSATKEGRVLRIRLSGQDTARRGKPANCRGATLLSYVITADGLAGSAVPPADYALWAFAASSTRNIFDFPIPPTVPAGSQMYFVAYWFNTKAQRGPFCQPVGAFIGGGVSRPSTQEKLKRAA